MAKKITNKIREKYELVFEQNVESIHSEGYLLKHKKTGANIMIASNDDNNKVFSIGFRTPPEDSTGVAHIIEHSVLCGSKNFPLKDPFVELVKGSLNTFLNAMTYPDKTVYPVASCNDADFQNLIHVYMDAVLRPNIYDEEKIFMQEGWHYDLENLEEDLKINGVVYNEMKGAFSAPDEVMYRNVFSALYPDTTYGKESGGDPEFIPELTYADFLDFHARYYHPSNSFIYLYGDMDIEEKLLWMDKEYLGEYDKIEIDSTVKTQEKFKETKYMEFPYAISDEESDDHATYLTYNKVFEDNLDPLKYIGYQVLDYVLCSSPGAPIQKALMEANIGKEIFAQFENGIKQPYFSIVAKGANKEEQDQFVSIIENILTKQFENGVNKDALEGALNFYEFKQREADFGGFPKGLLYGLQALDSWLYDESQPFLHVDALPYFDQLRELMKEGYFEKLIKEGFLDNTHSAVVMVTPNREIAKIKEKEFKEKMASYKETLSKEELEQIIQNKKDLVIFQDSEDSEEAINSIPLLSRSDIRKEITPFKNEESKVEGVTRLHHGVDTNGILYTKVMFEASGIKSELLPYMRLLKDLYANLDTSKNTYNELTHALNKNTGGISFAITTYKDSKNLPDYKLYFVAKVKSLKAKSDIAFSLLNEVLFDTSFENTDRILEVISEQKSKEQAKMTGRADQLAALIATSYFSETAKIDELVSGVSYYRFLEELEVNFNDKKEELVQNLKETMSYMFTEDGVLLDTTFDESDIPALNPFMNEMKSKFSKEKVEATKFDFDLSNKNMGYQTSAQVQYVCRAGDYRKAGLDYTGALQVLKVIMSYEYLWMNVRVKGGAYGCGIRFNKGGECYMSSYRDPNLENTIAVYEAAADYVRNFEGDERTITKYLIGAMSNIDMPLTPSAEGARSLSAYLTNMTIEDIQKNRDQVLNVTLEDIRALAPYIEALLDEKALCVVGNAKKIEGAKDLFENIEPLFH
jgi:Zn-dependent M16 (insulinase) family peptidase